MGRGFSDHKLRLMLNKRLYKGFIKLQADKELGRSFAGLLCFVEGLHRLGFLGDRDYELYRKKYSTPLEKDPEQVALMELDEAKERRDLNRLLGQCVAQFQIHKDQEGWVDFYREKAMKHPDLPNSKRLLALIEEART